MIPSEKEWNDTLIRRHGEALQKRFWRATVAICGLGGLGSNIAASLARAGVGRLVLIDFDRVDISNLHRQCYKASQIGMYKTEATKINLSEIAPYSDIRTHTVRITKDNALKLLFDADIICEAFDDAKEKAMLANEVLEKLPDKYLVAASGMAGIGASNSIKTRRIGEKFYLCGDGISGIEGTMGLVSARVMLCAAHQANAVLRILANEFEV